MDPNITPTEIAFAHILRLIGRNRNDEAVGWIRQLGAAISQVSKTSPRLAALLVSIREEAERLDSEQPTRM